MDTDEKDKKLYGISIPAADGELLAAVLAICPWALVWEVS